MWYHCLHVDNLFMCGNSEFEERVLKRLRKDYTIGSEDIDDIAFVGQRIRWLKANGATAPPYPSRSATSSLHEIVFERSLKDDVVCTPFLHTEYRSVLRMINWFQSRTQFHSEGALMAGRVFAIRKTRKNSNDSMNGSTSLPFSSAGSSAGKCLS